MGHVPQLTLCISLNLHRPFCILMLIVHAYEAYNWVGITLKKKARCIRQKFNND